MTTHDGLLHPDHQSQPSAAEEMYFATLSQAQRHLIETVGLDQERALYAKYGAPLMQAIVQWRGKQLGDGKLYTTDEAGKLQVAALPIASLIMALEAAAQPSSRGHAPQGHLGHAARAQGERSQG